MAIEAVLPATDENNSYGFEFGGIYYKIENMKVNTETDEIRINVRGYASAEARELQKTYDARREYINSIIANPEMLEAEKPDEYETVDDFRNALQEERREHKNVIGVYKNTHTVPQSELTLTGLDRASLLTTGYEYLKTLDRYAGGNDV